jgi:hypothetical protein
VDIAIPTPVDIQNLRDKMVQFDRRTIACQKAESTLLAALVPPSQYDQCRPGIREVIRQLAADLLVE